MVSSENDNRPFSGTIRPMEIFDLTKANLYTCLDERDNLLCSISFVEKIFKALCDSFRTFLDIFIITDTFAMFSIIF